MFAAYKKFWTHYADFSGRSSRSDFWWAFFILKCGHFFTRF